MAKGFQCDKCKSWQTGSPLTLVVEPRPALEIKAEGNSIEFYIRAEISLTPLTWRGNDFCRACRNDAIVRALTTWVQQLREEVQSGN